MTGSTLDVGGRAKKGVGYADLKPKWPQRAYAQTQVLVPLLWMSVRFLPPPYQQHLQYDYCSLLRLPILFRVLLAPARPAKITLYLQVGCIG